MATNEDSTLQRDGEFILLEKNSLFIKRLSRIKPVSCIANWNAIILIWVIQFDLMIKGSRSELWKSLHGIRQYIIDEKPVKTYANYNMNTMV